MKISPTLVVVQKIRNLYDLVMVAFRNKCNVILKHSTQSHLNIQHALTELIYLHLSPVQIHIITPMFTKTLLTTDYYYC